jgi:hypothetical protein
MDMASEVYQCGKADCTSYVTRQVISGGCAKIVCAKVIDKVKENVGKGGVCLKCVKYGRPAPKEGASMFECDDHRELDTYEWSLKLWRNHYGGCWWVDGMLKVVGTLD